MFHVNDITHYAQIKMTMHVIIFMMYVSNLHKYAIIKKQEVGTYIHAHKYGAI